MASARGQEPILLSTLITGHFPIALEQKNNDEAEGTNLHFPLFVQRKM